MLQLFTTDEFGDWFASLDDTTAEDVATALEIVEQLGPNRTAPGSSEYLLWYEHRDAGLWHELAEWGAFYGDTKRVVEHLESPRFLARLRNLAHEDAAAVADAIRYMRLAAGVPRRGVLAVTGASSERGVLRDQTEAVQRWYRAALALVGLDVADFPVHSSALRELSLRGRLARRCEPPCGGDVRLLYGVDAERDVALVVAGEWLDRAFYGDTVRRAERLWSEFLQGNVRVREPAPFR